MSTLPSRKRERSTVGFPKTAVKKTKNRRKQEVMKSLEKQRGGTQENRLLYVKATVMLTSTQVKALARWKDRSTGVKLTPSDDASEEVNLLLTKKQADAFTAGKPITLSQRTLRANANAEADGGFLPLLATMALENPVTASLIAAAAKPIAEAIGEQLAKGVKKVGSKIIGSGVSAPRSTMRRQRNRL